MDKEDDPLDVIFRSLWTYETRSLVAQALLPYVRLITKRGRIQWIVLPPETFLFKVEQLANAVLAEKGYGGEYISDEKALELLSEINTKV